jgi:formamidopyrimidine-DNA glycosylase
VATVRARRLPAEVPELPEVLLYIEALERTIGGRVLERVRLRSPSLLRTWDPPLAAVHGRTVLGFRRIGKRIAWELDGDLFLVFHLMVTGRFHLRKAGVALPRKDAHAAFDFADLTLLLTEAGTRKKASLHLVRGEAAMAELDPGGVEPLEATFGDFREALVREDRTLKRALTDPRILSGIGNAHSDEILHQAGLSPVRRTRQLDPHEMETLFRVTVSHLRTWTDRLRREAGERFPEKVTAFHPGHAVHGKHGQPCPVCGQPVQRIRYADRETNYCPGCQTAGRLLADRALSRLLGADFPRTLEELEGLRDARREGWPEKTSGKPNDP